MPNEQPSAEKVVAYIAGPSTLRSWLGDQLLVWLQRRCQHPGNMVAVDILENSSDDVDVAYCRRCGAVRIDRQGQRGSWRSPDPNLWRGK